MLNKCSAVCIRLNCCGVYKTVHVKHISYTFGYYQYRSCSKFERTMYVDALLIDSNSNINTINNWQGLIITETAYIDVSYDTGIAQWPSAKKVLYIVIVNYISHPATNLYLYKV